MFRIDPERGSPQWITTIKSATYSMCAGHLSLAQYDKGEQICYGIHGRIGGLHPSPPLLSISSVSGRRCRGIIGREEVDDEDCKDGQE